MRLIYSFLNPYLLIPLVLFAAFYLPPSILIPKKLSAPPETFNINKLPSFSQNIISQNTDKLLSVLNSNCVNSTKLNGPSALCRSKYIETAIANMNNNTTSLFQDFGINTKPSRNINSNNDLVETINGISNVKLSEIRLEDILSLLNNQNNLKNTITVSLDSYINEKDYLIKQELRILKSVDWEYLLAVDEHDYCNSQLGFQCDFNIQTANTDGNIENFE